MVNINVRLSRDKIVAVVDVAEGGARIAIITCPKAGPCRVLAHGHSGLSLDEKKPAQEIASIGAQIEEAGKAALKMYESEGHRSPISSAYVFLHAPWVESEVATVKQHFETDTRVFDSTIGELAQQGVKEMKTIEHTRLFESCVIRIALNGYPTISPANKYAQDIEVRSLASSCEPAVKSAAEAAVSKLFPVAEILWRSNMRALLSLIRELPQYEKCIAIDMHMTSTHLISIYPDTLSQRIVPEGVRTILSRLAPGKIPEETLSNMRMLERDACSTEACEAVQKSLVLAEPDLARAFGEAIGQMAQERRIPNDLLLMTIGDMASWLGRFFARIDFAQFSVTALPLSVHGPDNLDLSRFVESSEIDSTLAIDIALVNIETRD